MNRRELLKSTVAAGMGLAVAPLTTIGEMVNKKEEIREQIIIAVDKLPKYIIEHCTRITIARNDDKRQMYQLDAYLRKPLHFTSFGLDGPARLKVITVVKTFNLDEIKNVFYWDNSRWNLKSAEFYYNEQGRLDNYVLNWDGHDGTPEPSSNCGWVADSVYLEKKTLRQIK